MIAIGGGLFMGAGGWSAATSWGKSGLGVPVADGVQMRNNGGMITLLDPQRLKVHGVSYTADRARREGLTLVF